MLMLLMTLGSFATASAQYYWLSPTEENSVSLEILKPKFADVEGVGFLTSAWFLEGNFTVSEEINIFTQVPIAILSADSPDLDDETAIGNILIGMEYHSRSEVNMSDFITRLGFRPPIVSEGSYGAAEVGLLTDYTTYDAFYPKNLSVNAGIEYRKKFENMLGIILDFNSIFLLPTEEYLDNEILLNYGLTGGYYGEKFSFEFGPSGIFVASEDGDFGRRSVHVLGMNVRYTSGTFVPGLTMRIPLDDNIQDIIDFTFGFNLAYKLN